MRTVGLFDKLQSSSDLETWTDLTEFTRAEDIQGQFSDSVPEINKNFYRIVRSATGL